MQTIEGLDVREATCDALGFPMRIKDTIYTDLKCYHDFTNSLYALSATSFLQNIATVFNRVIHMGRIITTSKKKLKMQPLKTLGCVARN